MPISTMMKPRLINPIAFLIVGVAMLSISSIRAEMRTWTSADGKTLQAEFAGSIGSGSTAQVKLKLENGDLINYPISKLSDDDRIFVKGNLPTDPAALAAAIDQLVIDKMKESYYELRAELASLPQIEYLSNAEKLKRKQEIEREMEMCLPNERTTDQQFLRRIYLDIAGRIPTFNETEIFLSERNPNKRSNLIDQLLDSEAFAMRMYNYYSDLFRIREGVFMMGNGDLKVDPYIEYVKQSVRDDKPFDEMALSLIHI